METKARIIKKDLIKRLGEGDIVLHYIFQKENPYDFENIIKAAFPEGDFSAYKNYYYKLPIKERNGAEKIRNNEDRIYSVPQFFDEFYVGQTIEVDSINMVFIGYLGEEYINPYVVTSLSNFHARKNSPLKLECVSHIKKKESKIKMTKEEFSEKFGVKYENIEIL